MTVAARQQQRPLEQTTIHVVAISPLKEGRKMASVKDVQQGWFCIYPDKLHLINKGESYNVEYSLSDDGTTRFISGTPKHVTPTNGRQPVEMPEVAQKVAQAAQAAAQKPRPAMFDPVRQQATLHRSDPTPGRIFICGGFNNAVASHQVSIHDVDGMIAVVNNLRAVWDATLGSDE